MNICSSTYKLKGGLNMGKKTYTNEEIKKVADSIRKKVLQFAIERGGC